MTRWAVAPWSRLTAADRALVAQRRLRPDDVSSPSMLPLSDVNTAIIAAVLALRDSRPEAQRHRLDGRQRDGVPAVTAVNSFGEAGLPLSPSVRPPRAASVAGRGPPAHSRVVPHSAGKFTSMVLVSGEVPFLSRPCPLDEFTRLFTPRTLSLVKRSLRLWLWMQPVDYQSTRSPWTRHQPVVDAGAVGFEPTRLSHLLVFKTSALDR